MPRSHRRPASPKNFLTPDEDARVQGSIQKAESRTSAEIKLVLVRYNWGDLRDKTVRLFHQLGLDRTREHNAVMVLLVTTNRELAIFGDRGMDNRVDDGFWLDVRDLMLEHFRENRIGEGLCRGIERIGEKLEAFFPIRPDDANEISDEVAHAE